MYDLCTRAEQHEPAATPTEMESPEETQTHGCQAREQDQRESWEFDKKQGVLDKDIPTTPHLKTSLLGKRHHSLYANLQGFEMERILKVSNIF